MRTSSHLPASGGNADGNRNAPNLNWNGNERKLNANFLENDWNAGNRFLVLRKSLCVKYKTGLGGLFCDEIGAVSRKTPRNA